MASPELLAYIQSLLRNGYGEQQIRSYLFNAGYSAQQVDEAFLQLSHEQALAPSPSRPWVWIAGAILGLGIGGILVALLFAAPAAQITLRAAPSQVEVRAGESLSIIDSFSSTAAQSLTLSHVLVDPATDVPLGTPSERQVSLQQGSQQENVPLSIPSTTPPGRYLVQVSAVDAGGRETKTSFSISVLASRASCSDGILNQGEIGVDCGGQCPSCPTVETPTTPPTTTPTPSVPVTPVVGECPGGCNDFDVSTDDECVDGKCVYTPIPEICGNGVCNAGETSADCPQDCGAGPGALSADQVIDDARSVAANDETRATGLCSALPRPSDKDRCFSVIASAASKSSLCAAISEEVTRDQCYIDFALSKNEFDVCEKIGNRYMRGSCNSLRNLRQLELERAGVPGELVAEAQMTGSTTEQTVA